MLRLRFGDQQTLTYTEDTMPFKVGDHLEITYTGKKPLLMVVTQVDKNKLYIRPEVSWRRWIVVVIVTAGVAVLLNTVLSL